MPLRGLSQRYFSFPGILLTIGQDAGRWTSGISSEEINASGITYHDHYDEALKLGLTRVKNTLPEIIEARKEVAERAKRRIAHAQEALALMEDPNYVPE